MAAAVENWDEDLDFQGRGDLFTQSVSTVQTSISSRMSVNSESNVYEEDWKVQLSGNDDLAVTRAIQSAKSAGVPLPHNIPPSALVGGSIKRLGKKNVRHRVDGIDDWADDLDLPKSGSLALSPQKTVHMPVPAKTNHADADADFDLDDFDSDWAEGSLGIRCAGTRHDADTDKRNRSSSASCLSPSLGSQSEEDDLRGLEIPDGPVDLQAILKTRQAAEALRLPSSGPAAYLEQQQYVTPLQEKDDDFFNDLEVGGGELLDNKKLTLHKNVKQKLSRPDLKAAAARTPTTTLTFIDKSAPASSTRIPRLAPSAKQPTPRLAPVPESGGLTAQVTRTKPQATTTHAQLLRSKRSMPALKSQYSAPTRSTHPPSSSHAVRNSAYQLRRDSDPHRTQSPPPPRSLSRLSNAYIPDTPSRTSRRPDFAPRDLVREAATKKTLTKPQRRRFYGDGSELEAFDDLPTSVVKESKFVKQPTIRGPRAVRSIPNRLNLREQVSDSRLSDKISTPTGGLFTPRSPLKVFQEPSSTPSYLRDTAASRIARESRLAQTSHSKLRGDGPLMPVTTNWKAQIAARSPHASPSAQRNKARRVQPGLIRPGDATIAKNEKGMVFNSATQRWEGNENVLGVFDFPMPAVAATPTPQPTMQTTRYHQQQTHHHQPAKVQMPTPLSPPRPALIAPISAGGTQNIQVVGGMVFDPARMCWLKFKPTDRPEQTLHPRAADAVTEGGEDDDEDDPFAGIDDLKDASSTPVNAGGVGGPKTTLGGLTGDEWLVGEEFDLGPEFIKRQRDEEVNWRKRCQAWYPGRDEPTHRPQSHDWRWTIRAIAGIST